MFNPTRVKSFFCIIQIILQDLRRVDRLLQKFRTMISAIGLTLIMLDNTFFTQSLLLLYLQAFSKEIELSKAFSWRSNETSKIWCVKTIYFFEKLTKSAPPKKVVKQRRCKNTSFIFIPWKCIFGSISTYYRNKLVCSQYR